MKNLSLPASFLALAVFFCIPLISAAQGLDTTKLEGYAVSIIFLINAILVPLLLAIAFIVFLWGVYKYFIYGAADENSRADGRQFVLWGIIGFVVIFSLWGLVSIAKTALNLQSNNTPDVPTFQTTP